MLIKLNSIKQSSSGVRIEQHIQVLLALLTTFSVTRVAVHTRSMYDYGMCRSPGIFITNLKQYSFHSIIVYSFIILTMIIIYDIIYVNLQEIFALFTCLSFFKSNAISALNKNKFTSADLTRLATPFSFSFYNINSNVSLNVCLVTDAHIYNQKSYRFGKKL